ncbi:MAG: response regulator [Betaproteobacteria bacterium]|nr:response regulator [Betaproteobacteria bacterium]
MAHSAHRAPLKASVTLRRLDQEFNNKVAHMNRRRFGDKSLSKQVAELNKRAVAQSKVVSLDDYRAASKRLETKTILVVDDELVMRNAIKRIFEKDNYRVLVAKDAMELTKIVEDTRIDLILLDIQLPWVDGYELCGLLKSKPMLKDLPVAFISGNKTEEDIRRGFEAGCDEYITKPFDVDEIQRTVRELLNRTG